MGKAWSWGLFRCFFATKVYPLSLETAIGTREKRIEALNEKSRAPQTKRRRIWPYEVIQEIKKLREEHPNLGSEKIYPLLTEFY